jgi:DNA-directed RNA polymerase beta' subunit
LRAVIVLDPTLKIDEVDVPYKQFIVQYKGNIIKRVMADKGWTITKTTNFVASKFNYDDYIYKIMCDIVKEEQPKLILND